MSSTASTGRTAPRASPGRAKRLVDLVVGSTALVLAGPFLALIAAAIRVLDGTPVLFRQTRIGLNGRAFTLTKFRTMRPPRDDENPYLSDGDRVTRLGAVLRATSLDELPEIWHVVTGDMSLVGPRPLLPEHVPLFTPRQATRMRVRPGLTGLAQISGRQSLTFSRRLELDAHYVETRSAWVDLKIVLLTGWAAVTGRGVHTGQDLSDVDDIGLGGALG